MKKVLAKTLKVLMALGVAYVAAIAILTSVSPILLPISEQEDNDFDDFYDVEDLD